MKVSILSTIQKNAQNRGLLIIFPILDLTDLSQIRPSDIWAPFLTVIQRVSTRYYPDDILLIRIDESNPATIKIHWLLLLENKQINWTTNGDHLNQLLKQGLDYVTDALAAQFTVVSNNISNQIQLNVTNLKRNCRLC